MDGLVESLLEFSRFSRQPLAKRTVVTSHLVEEVLADLRADPAGRPVEVRVGPLPGCEADPALLRQVLINLLTNAFKFSRGKEAPLVEVGFQEQSGTIVYFIRDNGAGFDMKYAKKLFGVFQRLHRHEEFEGTGVGLSIVHRIIQRHGGRIWAEAEVGKGATFYFTLQT
jgi:light-regulated signal transduction histidine kinase (bacteriophytochrome)